MNRKIFLFCACAWFSVSCEEDEPQTSIAYFLPLQATAGSVVMVVGENFAPSTKVRINDVEAEIFNVWEYGIQFRVPAGATTGKISVRSIGTSETEENLEIVAPEGTWDKRTDFPGVWRQGAVAFSDGGLGYVGLGLSGSNPLKDFYKYDPSTDEWTQLADADFAFPEGFDANTFEAMGSFVKDEVAYVLFSTMYPPVSCFLMRYDIAQDQWEYISFPFQSDDYFYSEQKGAHTFNGKGLLGLTDNRELPIYDLQSGQWSTSAIYPGERIRLRSFLDSKGYFLSQELGERTSPVMWEYDIVDDTWQQKDTSGYPWMINAVPVQFNLNSSIYFGMGQGVNSISIGDMWKYTPATNMWKAITPCPYKYGFPAVFTINNKGYFVFGENETHGLSVSTVVFTP